MKTGSFNLDLISLQLLNSKIISRMVETGTDFLFLDVVMQEQNLHLKIAGLRHVGSV